MSFSHNKQQFNSLFKKKSNFVFFKEIKKLNYDPIPHFLNFVEKNRYAFLYESVEKGTDKGRYSICGYNSITTLSLKGKSLTISYGKNKKTLKIQDNPLNKVDEIIKSFNFKKKSKLPPMAGAFFGYVSYENIYNIEKIQKYRKSNKLKTPDLILFIPEILLIYDNFTSTLFILRHFVSKFRNKVNYENLVENINNIQDKISTKVKAIEFNLQKKKDLKIKSNIKKSRFLQNIIKAKRYIKNGDIFQVVPSQRFEVNYDGGGTPLYRVLRRTNPSPFMYYFNLQNFQIVGSSPEILVRLRSKKITVRPIAGTRPRGKNKIQDKKNEIELLADKKEVSEHLMLLDLGRNDVGKVAKKGSVKVTAKFIIERYSHVMHIVSNVIGKIKSDISPISALMAGFPAGTVSGAPKIRAMQIIDELENEERGIYSGGIGYISSSGDMDTCIVIRTGIIKKNKLYVQAGGGIVYDSVPENEYTETVNKAKAVINAASIVLGNKT